MAANDPRVEFRPTREIRRLLENLRQELSEKAGKRLSMSRVVEGIVERFFHEVERTSLDL